MTANAVIEVADMFDNPVQIVQWIETQTRESRKNHANDIFNTLIEQAAQPKSGSGNASARLCGFVDQASKAQSKEVRDWAFSGHVFLTLFDFYVEWNETDHHRSLKLVLDLVTQLIKRNKYDEEVAAARTAALDSLVSILAGCSTKPLVKSSIKTLDYLLAKRLFTLNELKACYIRFRPDAAQEDDLGVWKLLFTDLFRWMSQPVRCPIAGRLIVCIYRLVRQRGQNQATTLDLDVWQEWLIEFLKEEPSLLEGIKFYILLPIFKMEKEEALRFLRTISDSQPASQSGDLSMDFSAILQLAALETGKKVGLVEDPDLSGQDETDKQPTAIVLRKEVFESILAHPSAGVRSLALSLLITSLSTTKPFSSTTLDLLRKHLPIVFADADAKFRVDISGKARDMFKRVRGAIFVLKRSISRASANARKDSRDQAETGSHPIVYRANLVTLPEPQLIHCLDYHKEFLRWYVDFLCGELAPTVSYQRHAASVKALTFILRMEADNSKTWPTENDQELFYDLFDEKWMRALFDLVMDPFDDVRELAAGAIKWLLSDPRYRKFTRGTNGHGSLPAGDLTELLRRADERARRTARADHSDGVARACQLTYRFSAEGEQRLLFLSKLIDELDCKMCAAEEDLGRAVLEAPLHSDFASLCFTWQVVSEVQFSDLELEAVQNLQERLVSCCERVWSAVKAILCDDSPEGHLPPEFEGVAGLDTKDVLSYSFRAIHESSNLMRTIALTLKNRTRQGSISPPPEMFQRIGNLTFEQLSSLRHRGAFTTVSLTFATCCQQTKHMEDRPLLELWYKGTMEAIFAQASTTRRSAGIPSLMTGILSANASQPSFEQVMDRLIEVARIEVRATKDDDATLPQVHAYNCLKDIFKSSVLTSMGNKAEKYLPECLELAAGGLRSEVWAIRNCGLIFLRSLIDCLFGSGENKAMIESGWDGKANRIPYHRYPNLPRVLIDLLKTGHRMITHTPSTSSAAESVFPALDIIRRAGPPEAHRDELQFHVSCYLASPVWHVREIAARTLCSCLLHDEWLATSLGLFRDALSDPTSNVQNHVHGVLLTVKFVFERLNEVALDRLVGGLPELCEFLMECRINTRFHDCQDIVAAYLEIVNMTWAYQRAGSQYSKLVPFNVSTPATIGTALLKTQKIVSDVFLASAEAEPVDKLRGLLLDGHVGVNSIVTALEKISTLWHNASTSFPTLSSLGSLYIDICLKTGLLEAQVVAVHNLTEILDRLFLDQHLNDISPPLLRDLWVSLPLQPMNPALSNAVIRASGCIMAVLRHSQLVTAPGLQNWGSMMADAGLDEKDFDTRLAAAGSLRSFLSVDAPCNTEEYLPTLLALYDSLNDDDDEIRIVASAAATRLLGRALVPLEAASSLLQWLTQHFPESPTFRSEVARRIVGIPASVPADTTWMPADEQLSTALRSDDSLFAVEDKNLFIDEVRETKRWVAVMEALEWDARDGTLLQLDAWVCGGLREILLLLDKEDGPLGWASKAQVFAICSRITHCSVALEKESGSQEVQDSVARIRTKLATHDTHVSGLLMEPFRHSV